MSLIRLHRLIVGLVFTPVLFACSQPSDTAATGETGVAAGATANYNLTMDMAEFMAHVVEPVADSLWQSAGWVLDQHDGYYELYPTNDEEWLQAHNRSALIVELGNAMLLPGRVQEGPWSTYAEAMSTVGISLMAATDAQNNEDFFQAGAQLYSVCTACHQAYNPEILSRF
jgi:hypothetical protein